MVASSSKGVLQIPASVTKKPTSTGPPSKSAGRAGAPKLRLIVRRLPPGLTETEFWTAIGEEWKIGAGKVDWGAYKEGKVSREYVVP